MRIEVNESADASDRFRPISLFAGKSTGDRSQPHGISSQAVRLAENFLAHARKGPPNADFSCLVPFSWWSNGGGVARFPAGVSWLLLNYSLFLEIRVGD